MSLSWFEPTYARLSRRLRADHPREACAVGLGRDRRVTTWVPIPNRDVRPGRFAMDEAVLIRTLDRGRAAGLALLVFVHTHPDGAPDLSAADRAAARFAGRPLWPGVAWLVQVVEARREGARSFHPPLDPAPGLPDAGRPPAWDRDSSLVESS